MAEQNIVRERFTDTIFAVLEETFERVHGIYLDRGTSLFETLETLSAEQASQPLGGRSGSIAAKIDHACFYLGVLEGYMLGRQVGTVDWEATWRRQAVTAEEWAELRGELRAAYQRVRSTMRGFERWEGEEEIGGAVAICVHTAYHLGEIRQALGAVRP